MNLNDPFGRLASRDERDYQSLREVLRNEGVDNPESADAILEKLRKRFLGTVAVVFVVALLSIVLFPEFRVIPIVIAILILFWVVTTMVSGRRHIRRYVEEELTDRASR